MEKTDEKSNKGMSFEDKKKLLITAFMIIGLLSISYWRAVSSDPPDISFSSPEREDMELPSLEEMMSSERMKDAGLEDMAADFDMFWEEESEKRYVREKIGEEITIDRPTSFVKVEEEDLEIPGGDTEVVFLAHSRASHGATLIGMEFEKEEVEGVIKTLEEAAGREENMKMEVLEKEEKEEGYFLEVLYVEEERGLRFLSQGKVVFVEEQGYFLFVIAPEKEFEKVSEKAKHILSSIQINK